MRQRTDSAASNSSMAATMPEEPIDQEYGFDPSSEGKDYSTTTTQEELIDEADIVKTDGSCIYAMDSRGDIAYCRCSVHGGYSVRSLERSSCRLSGNVCGW